MSEFEKGVSPEYQFGQETIVKVTSEKLGDIMNSNMTPSEKVDAHQKLYAGWNEILEGLEKAKGI